MAIISMKVRSKYGLKAVDTYVILDPESIVAFCSEDLMRHLGTRRKNSQDHSQ